MDCRQPGSSWAIYGITDEAEWDPGEGRIVATFEPELINAFEQLARLLIGVDFCIRSVKRGDR